MSGTIRFSTEVEGLRTVELEGEFDISDRIHDAVVAGVTDCGGYDTSLGYADETHIEIEASGTVDVNIEDLLEEAYENALYDAGIDAGDVSDIVDIMVDSRWDSTIEVSWELEVDSTYEHDATSDYDEFVASVQHVRATLYTSPDALAAFDRIVRLAVGQQLLDEVL